MAVRIGRVEGYIIYDSRGSPTIEVRIYSDEGVSGRYASPSGKSVGRYEVRPLPEGGIVEAKKLVEEANRYLYGKSFENQAEFDSHIRGFDGSLRYERIGSILSTGLSFAAAEMASKSLGIPMFRWLGMDGEIYFPTPICNVIGGGKHSLNRSIDIQEILVYP